MLEKILKMNINISMKHSFTWVWNQSSQIIHWSMVSSSVYKHKSIVFLCLSRLTGLFTGDSLSGYGRLHVQYKPRKLSSYLLAAFSGSLFYNIEKIERNGAIRRKTLSLQDKFYMVGSEISNFHSHNERICVQNSEVLLHEKLHLTFVCTVH